jgi:hypothetical protein
VKGWEVKGSHRKGEERKDGIFVWGKWCVGGKEKKWENDLLMGGFLVQKSIDHKV